MNGQTTGGPSSSTPRWQAATAALSLTLLSVVVLFPLAVTLLALWGGVLGIAGAWSLDAVGVREQHVLKESVGIAVALLGSAGGIAAVGATASGITKLDAWQKSRMAAQPRVAVSPPNSRKSWWSTLLEHPWLALAGIALFVDACVVPFHASRAIRLPPGLLGGFIITGASLLFLFALVLSLRAYVYAMRTLWAGVRESAFFAGLVTAGSLVGAGIVLLIGHAFGQVASAVSASETGRALEACSGSADCSRRVLQSALDGQPRSLKNVPAEQFTPEERASFEQCVDEIHRKGDDGLNAREKAHRQAQLITRNTVIADDVVHDAVLAVCLSSHRIRNVVPYFIRSVQNAAKREWRRGRRYCSLVIEEPNWSPNLCIQENVEVWNETIWMEASANDALCGLSADERKIIEWYVWDGLSHAQIASKLRISEPTARQKFSRARKVLQDKFTERCQ